MNENINLCKILKNCPKCTLFPSKDQRDCGKFLVPKQKRFNLSSLQPFDKVLVKNSLNKKWSINLFSYYDKDNKDFPFVCINGSYPYCIPYNEHTAHLLGATDPYTKVGSITSC